MIFVCRPYFTLFLSTKKFVAEQIKNIVLPPPTTITLHKTFIMSDEEGEHRHHAAARPRSADDTLLSPHCRRRQCCAAAKLLPLPPSLTFHLSLLSSFPLPLPLLHLVDC